MTLEFVRIPAIVVAACLTIYWGTVVAKGAKRRLREGKGINTLPRDPVSLIMRIFWMAAIALQILHAWRIAANFHWGFASIRPFIVPLWTDLSDPAFQWTPPAWWIGLAFVMAGVVVVCLGLTFVCWRKMGRGWRIGIDQGEKLEIISSGPYRMVRHPIYALRILLDLCAIMAIPTPFMAIVTGMDILLLVIEASREEGYMEKKHGQAYRDYKRQVGRFVPRLFVRRGGVV
jgi:protein-S-isoprenylcysteine O-methyltransferase Ste14